MEDKKLFITGNEAAVLGAIDAGAQVMFGYPITPASEILQGWVAKADLSSAKAEENKNLQYLQTEDEIAAGFGVLGVVLGGKKAFTASAGPGHILLQDSLAMAENLRLPFVGIMMQRGGPSTGTVNFSQQEVSLAAFGGNGDGLRIVYSASSVRELYELVIQAFNDAWQYRFPAIVLGDGYLGKTRSTVSLKKPGKLISSYPILEEKTQSTNLRNCYSSEESFGEVLKKNIADWNKNKSVIAKSENFQTDGAEILIVAHGLVASAAKEAVANLSLENIKIGLFRPITLNPLDSIALKEAAKKAKKIFIIESALNQLARIIKYELAGLPIEFIEIAKPAEGFTPEEIVNRIKNT